MHNTSTWVKATVEEHEGIHWGHYYAGSLEIVDIQGVYLLFEVLCDNDNVLIANWKLVEDQAVGVCDLVNESAVFEGLYEGVFGSLVVFVD